MIGLLGTWALVAPTISDASAPSAFHAVIKSVSASPSQLPTRGGNVTVTGKVEHATSCQLDLLSRQSFPVVYSHSPKSCASGSYSAHVAIGAKPSSMSRSVAFALVALNPGSSSNARFYVTLGALLAPAVLSVSASPSALPSQGGQVTVAATVKHASSCQLELLSKQSFPVIYASNVRPRTSSFTAQVIVGGNPSAVYRTVAFALVARNGSSAFTGYFYVDLAAPPPPTTGTTAPAATTTLPAAATTTLPATTTTLPSVTTTTAPSITGETSPNWSGYADIGGPFTLVKGTFNASQLTDGTPASDDVDEWVGIDGEAGTSGSQDLIQAGIQESMVPCSGTGTYPNGSYSPDSFYICPWTFFIANGAGSEGPIPDVTVNEGDSVTVEIWQQSGESWAISMTDNTSGAIWSQGSFDYAGPGESAEWIVEAPTDAATGNFETLAPYDEPVTFSAMGVTGSGTITAITMDQDGLYVSTPGLTTTGRLRSATRETNPLLDSVVASKA